MTDHDWYMGLRRLALELVDLLERKLGISPRTAELRRLHKNGERDMLEG